MLAHTLEMNVVAEGIETAEQMSQLKILEAEYGQGYSFAKPLSSKETATLIKTNFHGLGRRSLNRLRGLRRVLQKQCC
jgi:EAL domain-containing protein (putative c-di-GMP-specific phosphodiesterase class I)